jgi:hypothetical protein
MDLKYNITLDTRPRAFERGKKIKLQFSIISLTAADIRDVKFELQVGEWKQTRLIEVLNFPTHKLEIEFESKLFKTGKYELKCALSQPDKRLDHANFAITIAPRINPDRFVLWHWPSTVHYNSLMMSEQLAFQELDKLADLGFTHAQLLGDWAVTKPDAAGKVIDYALTLGIELGCLISNSEHGAFKTCGLPESALIMKSDNSRKCVANPFHPEVIKRNRRWIEPMLNILKDYPGCSSVFMNSELEDCLSISMDQDSIRHHERQLGFDLCQVKRLDRVFAQPADDAAYIQAGVIADDDPEYLYSKYYFKAGDGWVATNCMMADIIHDYRPDVKIIADPFRLCSLYGRFDGVDAVSSWTYSHPDPKAMLFIETLRCEALPENKEVIQSITLYNYGGNIAPCGSDRKSLKDIICMGADHYLECAWLNLSRAPNGMGIYFSSLLDLTVEDISEFTRPPEILTKMRQLSQTVIQPLGGILRHLRNTPRKVAVLDSCCSRVYGLCPPPHNHYPNYYIYNFYTLLAMAHIPADVIFEETVLDGRLDQYEILALPCCDTLPLSVYREILNFAKNGGIVIADQWLRADIPSVIRFDFDFAYRKQVNANAIVRGTQFVSNEDTAVKSAWEQQTAQGVTAEVDRDIMECYSAILTQALAGKLTLEVACDTPRVLLNQLEYGRAKYLIAVNDNRAYDIRVGKFQATLDQGVAQRAECVWRNLALGSELYNLETGEKLNCPIDEQGTGHFELVLEPAWGAIIVALPQPAGKLKITGPEKISIRGKEFIYQVEIPNGVGALPLQAKITDPLGAFSDYSSFLCAIDGIVSIPFAAATDDLPGNWKISVKCLWNNTIAEKLFELSQPE